MIDFDKLLSNRRIMKYIRKTHKHVLNVLCFKLQCGSARTSRCGRRLSREKIGTKVL